MRNSKANLATEYNEYQIEEGSVQALPLYWGNMSSTQDALQEEIQTLRDKESDHCPVWPQHPFGQHEEAVAKEKETMKALKAQQKKQIPPLGNDKDAQFFALKMKQEAEERWAMETMKERLEMIQAMVAEEYARLST